MLPLGNAPFAVFVGLPGLFAINLSRLTTLHIEREERRIVGVKGRLCSQSAGVRL